MKLPNQYNQKKKYLLYTLFLLFGFYAFAHDIDSKSIQLRKWNINNKEITGSFLMMKNSSVYIENEKNLIINFPLVTFSAADKQFVLQHYNKILNLNTRSAVPQKMKVFNHKNLSISLFLLLVILLSTYLLAKQNKMRIIICFFIVGMSSILYSFKTLVSTTDPAAVDLAFVPFKPNVYTSFDSNYFYVQSKGIPTTHGMMTGIASTGWQQQVPIPQCYIGSNYWSIPLNPVVAATPVAVSPAHFTRGAIAVAVNGIAIFNPYTNTGADAYLTGQLDTWGGHCGRGDDYHYHTAPLHLYGTTSTTLPIAYALDGYAVYGAFEPSGVAMTILDANHGHYFNSVYHYHGTAAAPYMIGNMVGQVTEDASAQIIPQPSAMPVRTENWGPLNGALITSCAINATSNGYNTAYTLNGVSGYATNYSWSGTTYTFKYVTPTATTTTAYNGFAQCTVPLLSIQAFTLDANAIKIYPNPAKDTFIIELNETMEPSEISAISIYDSAGKLAFNTTEFQNAVKVHTLQKGVYYVFLTTLKGTVTKKIVLE
ncbi:MAG: T9SS type A sorting domain-containing protein [Flavobacterium sp.]|nr:T9SS type A sorting domain-containing protein [Flavobacterium sp.]